jgi:hypothetical protein
MSIDEAPERPIDLELWLKNGCAVTERAKSGVDAGMRLSLGRTNSEQALGFILMRKDQDPVDFVLNKTQVASLIMFLQFLLPRLRGKIDKRSIAQKILGK